jgi:hypothetical protein
MFTYNQDCITDSSFNSYYTTDTSFNFYAELNNDNDSTHTNNEEDENNKCLISNLPLDETAIELSCGHKFNYLYIYLESLNSKKTSYSHYNIGSKLKLGINQIRCPYCRTVFNNLLPVPFGIVGAGKMNQVNSLSDCYPKITCKSDNCSEDQVYVTSIGYYCKSHYKYCKNGKHSKKNVTTTTTTNKGSNKEIEALHADWSIYSSYKVDTLKTILKENKLKVSGTKPMLISRLLNNNIII